MTDDFDTLTPALERAPALGAHGGGESGDNERSDAHGGECPSRGWGDERWHEISLGQWVACRRNMRWGGELSQPAPVDWLAKAARAAHLLAMNDASAHIDRLYTALAGRDPIDRAIGEGGKATAHVPDEVRRERSELESAQW